MCRAARYTDEELARFCEACNNGEFNTAYDAYRHAFPEQCVGKSESVIRSRASRLKNSEKYKRMEEAAQRVVRDRVNYSIQDFCHDMDYIAQCALSGEQKQCSAAVQAKLHKAKALGIYTEKQQLDLSGSLNVSGLLADLTERLGDEG